MFLRGDTNPLSDSGKHPRHSGGLKKTRKCKKAESDADDVRRDEGILSSGPFVAIISSLRRRSHSYAVVNAIERCGKP